MSDRITRVATTTVVAGFASLALAGPADALLTHDPDVSGTVLADNHTGVPPRQAPATSSDDGGTPWTELGIGALGGLALAGAGTAAAVRVRHRHTVPTT
jgi:hypothetical protein